MRPMPRSRVLIALFASLLLSAACGDDTPTTPTEPTTPTTITETFSGRLERNFGFTHTFQADAGTVVVTLVTLTPDSAATIGMSLGAWNGTSCDLRVVNDRATQGTIVIGQASVPGNLCVRVHDSAGLSQATSYEVRVVHP
jgi:hypothetical protein